jgi:hypothetical protein
MENTPRASAPDLLRASYDWILAEQVKCRDYLAQNGRHRGAESGLADLVGEEVLLLIERRREAQAKG